MSTLPDAISHLLDSTLVYVLGGLPNLLEFILRRLCPSVFKRLLKRHQPGHHLPADQRGVNLNCLSEGNSTEALAQSALRHLLSGLGSLFLLLLSRVVQRFDVQGVRVFLNGFFHIAL